MESSAFLSKNAKDLLVIRQEIQAVLNSYIQVRAFAGGDGGGSSTLSTNMSCGDSNGGGNGDYLLHL